MNVQVTVLVGAVLYDEGVRAVKARRRVAPVAVRREELPRERQQHKALQRHYQRLEADVVDDDACANDSGRFVDGVEADAVAAP